MHGRDARRQAVLVLIATLSLAAGTTMASLLTNPAPEPLLASYGGGGEISHVEKGLTAALNNTSKSFALGTYLICGQWQSLCNYTEGVDKIKAIGGSIVLLPVGGEEVFYPSNYVPKPDWMPDNHIRDVVDYAHSQGLKVYAWWAMPHEYWLADGRHPEWISLLSNGTPTDTLGEGYFFRIVPPSRVISTPEYLDQLKGVIGELVNLSFDGIDINDNFQFVYDSSFDNFTVDKFQQDTGVSVLGGTVQERAQSIKDNQTILDTWYAWRAGQVTELLRLMQQYIRDAGSDIPLRPHLMSGPWGYWDWGYDWQGISEAVDVPYLMLGFGEENITEPINRLIGVGAKKIATSLYLFDIGIGDEKKLGQNLTWVRDAGASEVFLFTYLLAEEKGLWETLGKAVDIANQSSIPSFAVGQPRYGSSPTYVTSSTAFNLSRALGTGRAGSIQYRIDSGAWTDYAGNFTVNTTGPHTIYYYATDTICYDVTVQSYDIIVDGGEPASVLGVGQPQQGSSPTYVTSSTKLNLSAEDDAAGVASINYRVDANEWTEYTSNFSLTGAGPHSIVYYAVDNLGQAEVEESYAVFVDEYAPTVSVSPESADSGILEVERGQTIVLSSSDVGVGSETIYYSLDNGVTWHRYHGSIEVDEDITILYYAVDALGNRGTEQRLRVVVFEDATGSWGVPVATGAALAVAGAVITVALTWVSRRKREGPTG